MLLGIAVNTPKTALDEASSVLGAEEAATHMLYAEQQRLDGYEEVLHHASRRKSVFDRKVLKSRQGEVVFKKGDLVQYRFNQLDNTHSTKVKLAVRWSELVRVAECLENSYELATRDGSRVDGGPFHACRVRCFMARPGTRLWEEQKEVERLRLEEKEEVEVDVADDICS